MLTAQTTCARSAASSASEVVPFGVETIVVCSHSGVPLDFDTRFWKKFGPPAPSGKRCSSTGRPPIARISGSPTRR